MPPPVNDKWWLNWNTLTYANPDVFGPLAGGNTVQEAVYQTLQEWLPAYIYEFNRCLGGDILKIPKEYRVKPENRPYSKDVEASILVICKGTTGKPESHGNTTRATWNTGISVCVSGGSDWQETQALTFAYGVAVRAAIAQHQGLNGVAETSVWQGEEYLEKEHTVTRTQGLFVVYFNITTPAALNIHGGPPNPLYAAANVSTGPSLLPPDPLPTITSVNVHLENERTEQ